MPSPSSPREVHMIRIPLLSCLSLLVLANLVSAQAPFAGFPGVVADPSGKTLYVQNPKGGIDALNRKDGKLHWESATVARPLAVSGDLLAAQTNSAGKANRV